MVGDYEMHFQYLSKRKTISKSMPLCIFWVFFPAQVVYAIVDGTPEKLSDWKASFIFVDPDVEPFATGKLSKFCSATLIGDNVLITAKHCLKKDRFGKIGRSLKSFINGSSVVDVECYALSNDSSKVDLDVMLCESNTQSIATLTRTTVFESINQTPELVAHESEATLLGFGCRLDPKQCESSHDGFQCLFQHALGNQGELHSGQSVIDRTLKGGEGYIFTKGRAFVCSGDSGGGTYSTVQGSRTLTGVISAACGGIKVSRFVDTSNARFIELLKLWIKEGRKFGKKRDICGISKLAKGCRVNTLNSEASIK